jgi:hypothetical protein
LPTGARLAKPSKAQSKEKKAIRWLGYANIVTADDITKNSLVVKPLSSADDDELRRQLTIHATLKEGDPVWWRSVVDTEWRWHVGWVSSVVDGVCMVADHTSNELSLPADISPLFVWQKVLIFSVLATLLLLPSCVFCYKVLVHLQACILSFLLFGAILACVLGAVIRHRFDVGWHKAEHIDRGKWLGSQGYLPLLSLQEQLNGSAEASSTGASEDDPCWIVEEDGQKYPGIVIDTKEDGLAVKKFVDDTLHRYDDSRIMKPTLEEGSDILNQVETRQSLSVGDPVWADNCAFLLDGKTPSFGSSGIFQPGIVESIDGPITVLVFGETEEAQGYDWILPMNETEAAWVQREVEVRRKLTVGQHVFYKGADKLEYPGVITEYVASEVPFLKVSCPIVQGWSSAVHSVRPMIDDEISYLESIKKFRDALWVGQVVAARNRGQKWSFGIVLKTEPQLLVLTDSDRSSAPPYGAEKNVGSDAFTEVIPLRNLSFHEWYFCALYRAAEKLKVLSVQDIFAEEPPNNLVEFASICIDLVQQRFLRCMQGTFLLFIWAAMVVSMIMRSLTVSTEGLAQFSRFIEKAGSLTQALPFWVRLVIGYSQPIINGYMFGPPSIDKPVSKTKYATSLMFALMAIHSASFDAHRIVSSLCSGESSLWEILIVIPLTLGLSSNIGTLFAARGVFNLHGGDFNSARLSQGIIWVWYYMGLEFVYGLPVELLFAFLTPAVCIYSWATLPFAWLQLKICKQGLPWAMAFLGSTRRDLLRGTDDEVILGSTRAEWGQYFVMPVLWGFGFNFMTPVGIRLLVGYGYFESIQLTLAERHCSTYVQTLMQGSLSSLHTWLLLLSSSL